MVIVDYIDGWLWRRMATPVSRLIHTDNTANTSFLQNCSIGLQARTGKSYEFQVPQPGNGLPPLDESRSTPAMPGANAAKTWEGDITLVIEGGAGIYPTCGMGKRRQAEFLTDLSSKSPEFQITADMGEVGRKCWPASLTRCRVWSRARSSWTATWSRS